MPLRSATLPILLRRTSVFELPILPFLAPRVFQPWPSRGRHNHSTATAAAAAASTPQAVEQTNSHDPPITAEEHGSTASEQEQEPKVLYLAFRPGGSRTRSRLLSKGKTVGIDAPKAPKGTKKHIVKNPPREWQGQPNPPKHPRGLTIHPRPPPRTKFRTFSDLRNYKGRRDGRTSFFLRYSAQFRVGRIGRFVANRVSYRIYHQNPLRKREDYQLNGRQLPDPLLEVLGMNYEGNFLQQFKWLKRDKHPITPTVFDKQLLRGSSDSLKEEWERLDSRAKALRWPRLMLLTLGYYPSKILKFINATYCAPYPSSAAVADSLDYVILHYLRDLQPSHENHSVYLYKTIMNLLLRGPANYTHLSQNAIYYLILRLPSAELVAGLYRNLEKLNNPIRPSTLAQFASRLSQAGPEYEEIVFEMLQRLGELETDFNTPMMESLCTTILLNSTPDARIGHPEKFEYMLKCGLIPNIITYNVLLLKNLRAGDRNGSWRIFEMMEESGPEPDAYTYSTLLNDAKRRRDARAIERLMASYNKKGIRSSNVVVDVLHATLLFSESGLPRDNIQPSWEKVLKDGTAFREMLPYYCTHFHFPPLAELVPGFAEKYPEYMENRNQQSIDEVDLPSLVDPPAPALVVMITALLRGYEDPDTPKWFYEHWRNLVHDRHPFIHQLSTENDGHYLSAIYNSVLKSLGRHAINVPLCLKILGEMSKPLPDDWTPETSIKLPKPTVATWNILAELLMQHRQPRAAEKILSMMRERDIMPTYVTWRTLLRGYIKMQDVGMVVNTADRQERHGFPIVASTLREMKDVANRKALIEGLKVAEMERLEDQLREREKEAKKTKLEETKVVEEVVPERLLVVEDMPLPGPAKKTSRLTTLVERLKGKDPETERSSVV